MVVVADPRPGRCSCCWDWCSVRCGAVDAKAARASGTGRRTTPSTVPMPRCRYAPAAAVGSRVGRRSGSESVRGGRRVGVAAGNPGRDNGRPRRPDRTRSPRSPMRRRIPTRLTPRRRVSSRNEPTRDRHRRADPYRVGRADPCRVGRRRPVSSWTSRPVWSRMRRPSRVRRGDPIELDEPTRVESDEATRVESTSRPVWSRTSRPVWSRTSRPVPSGTTRPPAVAMRRWRSTIRRPPGWRFTCPSMIPSEAPDGYPVKADTQSGLYWTPDSGLYDDARAEIWFASEEFARTNGFVRAD